MDNKIEVKIDKIVDTLGKQAVTLERLTVTVEDHVMRTNELQAIVLPMQRKFNYIEGILKFIGFIGILAAIYEAVMLWIRH